MRAVVIGAGLAFAGYAMADPGAGMEKLMGKAFMPAAATPQRASHMSAHPGVPFALPGRVPIENFPVSNAERSIAHLREEILNLEETNDRMKAELEVARHQVAIMGGPQDQVVPFDVHNWNALIYGFACIGVAFLLSTIYKLFSKRNQRAPVVSMSSSGGAGLESSAVTAFPRSGDVHMRSENGEGPSDCEPTNFVLSRRAALGAGLSTFAAFGPAVHPAFGISATTMTGKTRPNVGIVLVNAVTATDNSVSATVILDGGLIATAAFDSKWKLAEGATRYDVEASTRDGETAYMQISALDKGESFAKVPKSWFSKTLFSVDGRYGAYGAPGDVKIKEIGKDSNDGTRTFDVSFSVPTPSGNELPRKGVMRALQAPGSSDVLMLTCSSKESRWVNAEAEARAAAASFRIVGTQPTTLQRVEPNDYRSRTVVG